MRTLFAVTVVALGASFIAVAPPAHAGICSGIDSSKWYKICVETLGPQCDGPNSQYFGLPEICAQQAARFRGLADYEDCTTKHPNDAGLLCTDPNAPAPEVIPEYVEPTWVPAPNS